MIVCITGHRPGKLPSRYGYDIHNQHWMQLRRVLRNVSLFLYARNNNLTAYTGMALGVDQAFAEEMFDLRSHIPHITCIAAVPCYNQEVKWPVESRELYHQILAQCDQSVIVTKNTFTSTCMEDRNRYMVDHSDAVIAVWDGKSRGGTANCVHYARQQHKIIYRIHPETHMVYVEEAA